MLLLLPLHISTHVMQLMGCGTANWRFRRLLPQAPYPLCAHRATSLKSLDTSPAHTALAASSCDCATGVETAQQQRPHDIGSAAQSSCAAAKLNARAAKWKSHHAVCHTQAGCNSGTPWCADYGPPLRLSAARCACASTRMRRHCSDALCRHKQFQIFYLETVAHKRCRGPPHRQVSSACSISRCALSSIGKKSKQQGAHCEHVAASGPGLHGHMHATLAT